MATILESEKGLAEADLLARGREKAADITREARELLHNAGEALDKHVHEAMRASKSVRRGVEALEDLRDEAIHQVKRHPAAAVGITLGAGLVAGFAVGCLAHRWR
jgi:hypothetical protein